MTTAGDPKAGKGNTTGREELQRPHLLGESTWTAEYRSAGIYFREVPLYGAVFPRQPPFGTVGDRTKGSAARSNRAILCSYISRRVAESIVSSFHLAPASAEPALSIWRSTEDAQLAAAVSP